MTPSSVPGSSSPVPVGALVVGIDGTERDAAPLAWAVAEARRTGAPLHLVHGRAVIDPALSPDGIGMASLDDLTALDGPDPVVDEALAAVQQAHPDLAVTASRPWGSGPQALLTADGVASAIVVGSGRKGGVERFFLGSTSLTTAMHARCPVVVVGPDAVPAQPFHLVVVGVDGSVDSRAAVAHALAVVRGRGGRLRCVSTFQVEFVDGVVVTEPGSPEWERVVSTRLAAVRRIVAECGGDPDAVEVCVVKGAPAEVLLAHSAEADLLVVGSRGRGGVTGMLLGSVSHTVLGSARCPVAVVTPGAREGLRG